MFDSRDLTTSTKIAVYHQCLMPLLMYGSETWTLYQHHVRQLRTIQQRHLRLILNIKWDHFVSNEEVLRRAGVDDIKSMLIRSRLRWLGHICRMDDTRAPKQLMYVYICTVSLFVVLAQLVDRSSVSKILAKTRSNVGMS